MTFAILPVKDPRHAKQRLAARYPAAQREALARLLFRRMITTLLAARGIDRIAVATCDGESARQARGCGALVFEETEQRCHSDSADRAARLAIVAGADRVLLVPIDVPLAAPPDIERLALCRAPLGIVPSADRTGTNALVRTPPDCIPSRFGPGSFVRHLDEGRRAGLDAEVLDVPGLMFDIDTPEDVAELRRRAPGHPAAELLSTVWD